MDNWIPFDVLDLVKRRSWPRVVTKRFFEINPLGQVRYYAKGKYKYVNIKPVKIGDQTYFAAEIGWTHGNPIIIRIPTKDLLKRYFNS